MKIVVIGAGLAGAATAYALAQRGCHVTVLEASAAHLPTAPSSGLPAALMAPHYSADDSAISQLSRLGVAASTQAARALLVQGRDWQPCGALQRAGKLGPQARWFGDAAWVKPAALVAAWLAHPRIKLRTGAAAQRLQRVPGPSSQWRVLDAQNSVLAQADAVVLANAYAAQALVAQALAEHALPHALAALATPAANAAQVPLAAAPRPWLHQVAGQVVYGPWNADWQALWPQLLPELAAHSPASLSANISASHSAHTPCAINGNGHFIPAIAWQGGPIWLSGSTYEHAAPHQPQITPEGMANNLQRLQQLIPAAAGLLSDQHRAGLLQAWAGTRCTTRDRLPAVGAVSAAHAPGLYVCTAMGSRGLSFAALCGQHVAASITGAADSPLTDSLGKAVDAARFSDFYQ
jgi:tRNA 5-methylaminomethyl-2-thiouridine biosynthesis bifunctional protein